MGGFPYSAADFTNAMLALLPRGAAWPREPDSVPAQVLGALAPTYARQAARSFNLLADAFPTTAFELLPEWEATVGLPDPCTPLNPSLAQRVAAVAAKVASGGGQSTAYFTAVAAAMGMEITVSTFMPFSADQDCDQPDYDPSWIYAWQVATPAVATHYFDADASVADDPLETFDGPQLQCRLQQIAPAHTTLIFVVSS